MQEPLFLRKLLRKLDLPQHEADLLAQLEDHLAYVFKDLKLLKQALSHKSYINENKMEGVDHNERLEFLGDAVLELSVSDSIMVRFPKAREGEMSKLRASIVNEKSLADAARKIDLGRFMFLGRGEEQCDGRSKNSLLADAFEAVLGAMYLDGGFLPPSQFVKNMFGSVLDTAMHSDINQDFKTRLQEEAQNRFKLTPQYRVVSDEGPDHDKTFRIEVLLGGKRAGLGEGKSKKQAEQRAAEQCYQNLDQWKGPGAA